MDAAIERAIADRQLPGGVLWVEHNGKSYHKAFGRRALVPKAEPMTEDTIFDAASMTKVLATAPALMILFERGKVKLDEPITTFLPELKGGGKEAVTLRHLLTHTSGFNTRLRRDPDWADHKKAFALIGAEKPGDPPGTVFRYSDINFIVLGEVIHRVTGQRLDEFASREIFEPLKMKDTRFLPPDDWLPRIAPTERVGREVFRAKVHDPKARRMGGVAGHAGVFTTAADVARFARMMLKGGELDGVRILRPETVKLMTIVQTPAAIQARRGLGWDIDSAYSRPRGDVFPIGSYGHTGFTGVCLWIDPFSKTFWMLLSNRVHPESSGNIYALQKTLATLAAQAVTDFDFQKVPGALLPSQPSRPLKSGPQFRRPQE
ncbi:MAG: beta-lactamase family protein [Verrucomicrobia bacterium]|nr:beta-lactamase family protein [Verrucomicrobiota bacterium]